jgi:hypothetical protein
MNRFFVETFSWIALANSRDQWHRRVKAFDDALEASRFSTTDEVLTEFLTFYSEGVPGARRRAALFARRMLADDDVVVLPQTRASFLGGLTVLSQSSIFGQNPKIGCQEFNDLQTPKLSKKQLCDRTLMPQGHHDP